MKNKHKTCSQCGARKNISNFHRRKHSRDGRHNVCIECRGANHKANRTLRRMKLQHYDELLSQMGSSYEIDRLVDRLHDLSQRYNVALRSLANFYMEHYY